MQILEYIDNFPDIYEANRYLRANCGLRYEPDHLDDEKVFIYSPSNRANLEDDMAREANGLILDEAANVLASFGKSPIILEDTGDVGSYLKFGESYAEEEEDGVKIVVYFHRGRWHVGTASSATGLNYLENLQRPTFSLEYEVKSLLGSRYTPWHRPFSEANFSYRCYVFDFVAPYNTRVKEYDTPELILGHIYDRKLDKILSPATTEVFGHSYSFKSKRRVLLNSPSNLIYFLAEVHPLSPGLKFYGESDNYFLENGLYRSVKNSKAAGTQLRIGHITSIVSETHTEDDLEVVSKTYPHLTEALALVDKVRGETYQELMWLWASAKKQKRNPSEFAPLVEHHPLKFILHKKRNDNSISIREEVYSNLKHKVLNTLVQVKYGKESDLIIKKAALENA